MLTREQLRIIAQEIDRAADGWQHECDDRYDREQLWEVVRRASHAIQAVAEIEREELTRQQRSLRARYMVEELEIALDAARRARVVMDWARDQ